MGAPINHSSGNGEEKGADHAVGKHLQDRTGNAEDVGRRKPEQNKTHVADTRVADHKFQVALTQRDGGGVNNSDNRKDCDPGPPHLKALREKIHRYAQSRVSAEFHHDAGEQH